ncbi:MAG: LuxR C-terminal-related transcriptional regulator, partial [Gammaproteobacteria bacterium]|nr:LuxR C-terminal-related transcriptional regulator [Gammaproteobacteria bacterium]
YLCLGKSAKEIAKITNISFRTVEKYLESLIKKTHSSRRTDLVQKLSRYFSDLN